MMKKLFVLLCLLPANRVFSQDFFTKFVEKKQVRFATYFTDTFHFSNPNLSLAVRTLVASGNIKASISVDGKKTGKPRYAGSEEIRAKIFPNRESKVMDPEGNVTATVVEAEDPLFSARYLDEQTNDMVEIPQILYIQSGRLRSYIPFFSTKYAVFTSWGQKLGISNAFNTGFNADRSTTSSVKKKSKLLGSTMTKMRLDTFQQENLLKQLYGQNMLQALWPFLGKKQYEIYRLDSTTRIEFEKLHMGLVNKMSVPVYDEVGNLTGTKVLTMQDQPLLPSVFEAIQVKQNWYYSERKNILFSTITELILHGKNGDQISGEQIVVPVLKILLK